MTAPDPAPLRDPLDPAPAGPAADQVGLNAKVAVPPDRLIAGRTNVSIPGGRAPAARDAAAG